MKKFLLWIANLFHIDLSVEKIVIKEVIKEVKVPYEVVKEVEKIKEVPIYKEVKYIALKDEVTNDTYVEGNLVVKGYLYVDGDVSCYKLKEEEA